jgi:hypothetical protein
MTRGFVPISLERYVELHLASNPGTNREDLVRRLRYAMDAHARGVRCQCGEPIWIIGSAEVGFSCFTCITGEAVPDHDYEITTHDNGLRSRRSRRSRGRSANH